MIQSARLRGPVVADSGDAHRSGRTSSTSTPRKQPFHHVPVPLFAQWTRTTSIFFWTGVAILAIITISPIFLLEEMSTSTAVHPTSLHALLLTSQNLRRRFPWARSSDGGGVAPALAPGHVILPVVPTTPSSSTTTTEKEEIVKWVPPKRGHIQCDVSVDDMVYWNDPQSSYDQHFRSPFLPYDKEERFLTFEPDSGGWNNIRMSLEILMVFAAVTGRTLVLPPNEPMYLLGTGKGAARSFGSFFPLNHPELQKHVKVITMKEFIEKHGPTFLSESISEADIQRNLLPVADTCVFQPGSDLDCDKLNVHLRKHGYQPPLEAFSHCFLFDETYYTRAYTKALSQDSERIGQLCGNRTAVAYAAAFSKYRWIHWQASDKQYRLLNHFYTFFHFTNTTVGNYYKRFVRDFLHYKDEIYCAAGKIVHALENLPDGITKVAGEPSFSSLHIRRGDFQYKKVKLTAEEWVENTKHIFRPGEVLYIATDERNKTFFEPFVKQGYQVRYLDDYYKQFELSNLDSAFMGMIDTIVASRGRTFVGTWFSTFSGYINRMRGYLGYDMKNSWYGWKPRQTAMHSYQQPHFPWPVREWPLGWEGIDENDGGVKTSSSSNLPVAASVDKVQTTDAPKPSSKKDEKTPPLSQAATSFTVKIQATSAPKDSTKTKEIPTHPKQRTKPNTTLSDIASVLSDAELVRNLPLARGVAGRPMSQTPALIGARRGHIECDINVDSLAYWNDPQGERDIKFKSPYAVKGGDTKYISFAPDSGGWNNIRMSMEIIFVIAAATGRTLVLPPKEPLYLLTSDKKNKYRGFGDFFPLHATEFQKRVPTISTEEFVRREGGPKGRLPIPEANKTRVMKSIQHCENRAKSEDSCMPIRHYLETVGYVPNLNCGHDCVIFDDEVVRGEATTSEHAAEVKKFCGKRNQTYWTREMQDPILIHFKANDKDFRLLAHFYGFLHFTNSTVDHYFKRFVRDFLHYNDQVYCAAGKIVKALQVEAQARGFNRDANGNGGYSSMHIRRGDFQFKVVKLSAEDWYNNTKEIWQPNEIIYIATDERNKTFFEPIAEHHDLRYLDDYWQLANLSSLDPNYMGMIDTIVSSRGRAFAGTWFSTFTGYINRMRGYHGLSMKDSWYSWLERKEAVHKWDDSDLSRYSFELPNAWVGVDADEWPSKEVF